MEYALLPFRKYAVFSGRSRRREYWLFTLFCFVCEFALGMVDGLLGFYDIATGIGLLSGLFVLSILIPSFAVGVRRLHDMGRSGWLMLAPTLLTVVAMGIWAHRIDVGAQWNAALPIAAGVVFLAFALWGCVSKGKADNQFITGVYKYTWDPVNGATSFSLYIQDCKG